MSGAQFVPRDPVPANVTDCLRSHLRDDVPDWVESCPHEPVCDSERDCVALVVEDYRKYGR